MEEQVKKTLEEPDGIRISQDDADVYLYYRRLDKHKIVVVARHLNEEGFIITSYITDKVKEGKQIWER